MPESDAKSLVEIKSHGFNYGVKHFVSPKSGSIHNIIADILKSTEQEIIYLIQLGSVYLNNKRAFINDQVESGDLIRVHTQPRRYKVDYDWLSLVVFEHSDFLVLNKPSGLPSHPSVDNQIENSLTQLQISLKKNILMTHRLDTLTEGLIVYGKTAAFVNSFNKQLAEKQITKKYIALIETTEKLNSHLVHYMEPSPRAPKNVSAVFQESWDFCELKIEQQKNIILQTDLNSTHCSWVKINLLTGRTHQIRSQFAEVGAPVLGDTLYGSQVSFGENKIALRAQEIEFFWQGQLHKIEIEDSF